MARPMKVWTSASRKGTNDLFRWCTSKVPLNVSAFTWNSGGYGYYPNNYVSIYVQTSFANSYFNVDHDTEPSNRCQALCEEQPL